MQIFILYADNKVHYDELYIVFLNRIERDSKMTNASNRSKKAVVMKNRREQLLIDAGKCTGCARCVMACSMKHDNWINPSLSRVRILEFESPRLNVPVICMACEKAPCMKVCPMNARVRKVNGTVVTDTDRCIGCRACLYICPVGSPGVNPYTGHTMTCDMCADDAGGPWCVAACKDEGALTVSGSDRLTASAVRERAARVRKIFP